MTIRLQNRNRGQDNSSMENMLEPIPNSDLIASSPDAIDAMKTAAGLTDRQFAGLCIPVLRAYADFVQRLPFSSTAFGSARGAWDFGLAAAMVAYRYAGTVIFFPTLGSEERRALEPQCRYMAFLATLATAVATVAESGTLTCADDEYHPLCCDTTLHTWLTEHRGAKFAWRVPAAPLSAQASAAIAAKFIPTGLLANFDLRAILMMYDAITPKTAMNGVESTLARAVRLSTQSVLDHYKAKQAGTFQPGAITSSVSTADADNIARKMLAAANPAVLVNPLEAPAPSAPQPQPQPQPQAAPSAPAEALAPAAPAEHLAAPQAVTAGHMPAAPSIDAPGGAPMGDDDVLARAPKVLREWFSALANHPQFHVLKDQLKMTEEGIEVPVSMLGMFGISSAMIRKMMDEAGLIIRRSDNARGVILHPGLRSRFVPQQPK